MTAQGGIKPCLRRWHAIGRFTRGEAWLLAFWWDCRRNYRAALPAGEGPTPVTDRFLKGFGALTDNPVGDLLAMAVGVMIYLGLWGCAEARDLAGGR